MSLRARADMILSRPSSKVAISGCCCTMEVLQQLSLMLPIVWRHGCHQLSLQNCHDHQPKTSPCYKHVQSQLVSQHPISFLRHPSTHAPAEAPIDSMRRSTVKPTNYARNTSASESALPYVNNSKPSFSSQGALKLPLDLMRL